MKLGGTVMTEIWKALPGVPGVEVSTLGRVRTLDRVVSTEKKTQFTEGRILKQYDNGHGYFITSIPVDGKWASKKVHRIVAQTFIPNQDNLQQVNHRDCNRKNNNVENLEWCDNSYNVRYREKYGKAENRPVFAINLSTLEVSHFNSQIEASRKLGANRPHINDVIKGRLNKTHGYWFTSANDNADDIINRKLHEISKTRLMINMEGQP